MTDQQAKNLTTEVFGLIRQSMNTEALKRIIDEQPALSAYRMNTGWHRMKSSQS